MEVDTLKLDSFDLDAYISCYSGYLKVLAGFCDVTVKAKRLLHLAMYSEVRSGALRFLATLLNSSRYGLLYNQVLSSFPEDPVVKSSFTTEKRDAIVKLNKSDADSLEARLTNARASSSSRESLKVSYPFVR